MPGTGVVEERPAGHEDLPVREQGRGLAFASCGHAAGGGPGVGVRVVEHGRRCGLRVLIQADEPAGDQHVAGGEQRGGAEAAVVHGAAQVIRSLPPLRTQADHRSCRRMPVTGTPRDTNEGSPEVNERPGRSVIPDTKR